MIKERWEYHGYHYLVRTKCYGSSFEFIKSLVEEAKKDFPDLIESQIIVQKYRGNKIKGIYGIEFTHPTLNEEYSLIRNPYPI